jgi:hypothetical protein
MKIAKTRRLTTRGYYLLYVLLFFGPIPTVSWMFQEIKIHNSNRLSKIDKYNMSESNTVIHIFFGTIVNMIWWNFLKA